MDLISYNVLANSKDIKKGLLARNYKPFDSHNTVANAVKRYADKIRKKTKEWLRERKEAGDRFSSTTDEWTDMAIRRFACVNIHLPGGEARALGMIRIEDTFDAEAAAELLSKKLAEFNLRLDHDIASVTTDGAAVMVRMGTFLDCEHQLCHSHGIHLVSGFLARIF